MKPCANRILHRARAAFAAASVAGVAIALTSVVPSRLFASFADAASSVLPLLTAALVVLVGLKAATPCVSWWEGALELHRRRRGEGVRGEPPSPQCLRTPPQPHPGVTSCLSKKT